VTFGLGAPVRALGPFAIETIPPAVTVRPIASAPPHQTMLETGSVPQFLVLRQDFGLGYSGF